MGLCNTNSNGVNMSLTNPCDAKLIGDNMCHVNLYKTNLCQANLNHAILHTPIYTELIYKVASIYTVLI